MSFELGMRMTEMHPWAWKDLFNVSQMKSSYFPPHFKSSNVYEQIMQNICSQTLEPVARSNEPKYSLLVVLLNSKL